jgi:hypothetical protein
MLKEILVDIWVILKLLVYLVYTFIENILRSWVIPADYLRKNVRGQTVLVTGAGTRLFVC